MGPRSHERGNTVGFDFARVQRSLASMGPRSHERGNICSTALKRRRRNASMGPRSHERGNADGQVTEAAGNMALQWGRVLMNAETRKREDAFNGAAEGFTRFNGAAFS